MKKIKASCLIILVVVVVVLGVLIIKNLFSQDKNREKPLDIECISETEYKLYVSDTRQSDQVPMEMEIVFSVDEKGQVVEDSIIETHNKKYDDEYGYVFPEIRNKTSKTLLFSLIAYDYQLTSKINLDKLEITSMDEVEQCPITVEQSTKREYGLHIADVAYDEKTDIDIHIQFAIDENGMVQEDSVVTGQDQVFAYIDNIKSEEIYVSVVARDYDLIARFNLETLEVLSWENFSSVH